MRNIFIVLTILSSLFAVNVEARQQILTTKKQANVSQAERKILQDNCWMIRARIAERYAGMGAGALSSSGYQNQVKSEITNYLNSVGTPTALQLLKEIQANNFKDYLLKNLITLISFRRLV